VEKCEKVRRPGRTVIQRNALLGEVYAISGADATLKMRACSACAGDYEDPDRTAWTTGEQEQEEDEPVCAPRETTEEFPAEDR
jgi:hypothetical protein